MGKVKSKDFLDTSVARPLIISAKKVKKYYDNNLTGDKYIPEYVRMEYNRGFILNCIEFFGLLSNPNINEYAEALMIWQNTYKSRAAKAVLTLTGGILDGLIRNPSTPRFIDDKDFQQTHLAFYIQRLKNKIETYKNPGIDVGLCVRTSVALNLVPSDANRSFIDFRTAFSDKGNCKKCKINSFISKNSKKLGLIAAHSSSSKNLGFDKIKKEIKNVISSNKDITCTKCSKIGDAVITLLCPPNFHLAYTDASFIELTKVAGVNGTKHLPETEIIKRS